MKIVRLLLPVRCSGHNFPYFSCSVQLNALKKYKICITNRWRKLVNLGLKGPYSGELLGFYFCLICLRYWRSWQHWTPMDTHINSSKKTSLISQRNRKRSNLARQKSSDTYHKKLSLYTCPCQQKWKGEPRIPPLLGCDEVPPLSPSHAPLDRCQEKAEWEPGR